MWRYPLGSGGKRVTTSETLPSRTSAATISRMKSLRPGVVGLCAPAPPLLIASKRLVPGTTAPARRVLVADVLAREKIKYEGRDCEVCGRRS
jgi:hypothetical protein